MKWACGKCDGKKPVKVRWVDVNKGDDESPNVRCRIVAKDFNIDKRPDLFAATPLLEYLRYLISRCASSQLSSRKTKLMVQDVNKAYFYAPATRDVYVELLPERAQPGMCAQLHKSLYGTRDAALNWAQAYSEVLEKMGLVKGKSSPCNFYHAEWGIRTVVHGNDILSEGPGDNLKAMDTEMRKSFALKTEILGGDPGDVQSLKVLNRHISWRNGEIHWEAGPRHVEILAKQLGLEGASTVKTLGYKNDSNKTFRFRDLDEEDGGQDGDTACYVDELFTKKSHGVSPGRVPASPLMGKADPKLTRARWADADSEEDEHKPLMELPASSESRRRADLCAEGWLEGSDGLWRKSSVGAEWMPRCEHAKCASTQNVLSVL